MTKLRTGNPQKAGQMSRAVRWAANYDPLGIVKLARERSKAAILKLEKLMNGDAGTIQVLEPKTGMFVDVPIEVPATVQAKCAELIIERAYGKSPQAILFQEDAPGAGDRALTIAEKILRLQQVREGIEQTSDLEASEITEVETSMPASPGTELILVPNGVVSGPVNPQDLI